MVGRYNRKISRRKALRKKRISDGYWSSHIHSYYDNLHQYSKNKIHCSCPCCSPKTKNRGSRRHKGGNYSRTLNYKACDLRKLISMDNKEADYFNIRIPKRRTKNW